VGWVAVELVRAVGLGSERSRVSLCLRANLGGDGRLCRWMDGARTDRGNWFSASPCALHTIGS
jgi:hypothetical protein